MHLFYKKDNLDMCNRSEDQISILNNFKRWSSSIFDHQIKQNF